MPKIAGILYGAAMYLLAPAILMRYLLKGMRDRSYLDRLAERFGLIPELDAGTVWIHAVSVGEVNAAAPLIKALLESKRNVFVSCTTPTGSARIISTFGADVEHRFAPIDVGMIAGRYVGRVRPAALVIMETEIWPNLIRACAKRDIPVHFANMRISDRTYVRALRLRSLFAHATGEVESFSVQTRQDGDRVKALGANPERVHVAGNLKFESPAPKNLQEHGRRLRERWGADRPAVILGSSHAGEEELFLNVVKRLRERYPSLVGIIAPRHPQRFEEVAELTRRHSLDVLERSKWDQHAEQPVDMVLVDTMGELIDFYAASDVVVVGGSFTSVGGHNVLEALVAERPVAFGPDMSNFREIAKSVLDEQAGVQVRDAEQLGEAIRRYLDDETLRQSAVAKGLELMRRNKGALRRTMANLRL